MKSRGCWRQRRRKQRRGSVISRKHRDSPSLSLSRHRRRVPLAVFAQFFNRHTNTSFPTREVIRPSAPLRPMIRMAPSAPASALRTNMATPLAAWDFSSSLYATWLSISIEPLITYNFNWLDLANLVNASCSAFLQVQPE